jgi:hypothetical protein
METRLVSTVRCFDSAGLDFCKHNHSTASKQPKMREEKEGNKQKNKQDKNFAKPFEKHISKQKKRKK